MTRLSVGLSVVLSCVAFVAAWTTDDLALFDLVEELDNKNFYELLEVDQNANSSVIRRSYRRLSLLHHPDKSKEPDAAEKFRQLAAVNEILQNKETRETYNQVLEFGLPDWKQPVFYYRQLRSMPLWESLVIILLITCTAQFLMMWGQYADRKYTIQNALERQLRKQEKKLKRKHNVDVDELIEEELQAAITRPQLNDLWPCVLVCWLFRTICASPQLCRDLIQQFQLYRNPVPDPEPVERVVKERVRVEKVEYDMADAAAPVSTMNKVVHKEVVREVNTGPWTLDELNYLVRLSATKYPVGTPNRWQQIAETLNRPQQTVTSMIGKLKNVDAKDYNQFCATNTSALPDNTANKEWTQEEQRLFETALKQYDKSTPDRWQRIADVLPDRSKEECVARFKQIVARVQQRRAQAVA